MVTGQISSTQRHRAEKRTWDSKMSNINDTTP